MLMILVTIPTMAVCMQAPENGDWMYQSVVFNPMLVSKTTFVNLPPSGLYSKECIFPSSQSPKFTGAFGSG